VIIVVGTIEVDPEQRDAFIAEQADRVVAGRAEPGRLAYELLSDPEHPDQVRLYERWEDVASFDAHMRELPARIKAGDTMMASKAARRMTATRYDVSGSSQLA
jgi:quinol monooxygenase YgiN